MELTIINPAVMDPSQIPRTKRTAKRPAKFLQAAWQHKTTPQMNMFKLEAYVTSENGAPCKACAANLIHFPTGNLCKAKFCGISKARYPI
jgi:hypothetical protein